MSALVFVDANVFIYSYDSSETIKRARAAQWLAALWRDMRGRTSMQVLSECQWNLTRKFGLPAEKVWDGVSTLFAWEPQPVNRAVLETGREIERRYRLSWWDSLIVAAAQLQNCSVLLTEDLQDGEAFGMLRVVNPFLHAVREPVADYLVARAAPLHRPRGRPRRAYA